MESADRDSRRGDDFICNGPKERGFLRKDNWGEPPNTQETVENG